MRDVAPRRACQRLTGGRQRRNICPLVRRHFALAALASLALLSASCGGSSESDADSSESFTNETWATVVSEPDDHEGAMAKLVGRVFTVERDEDATYMQVWIDVENTGGWGVSRVRDPRHLTSQVSRSYAPQNEPPPAHPAP
jgi:hypothetical protein